MVSMKSVAFEVPKIMGIFFFLSRKSKCQTTADSSSSAQYVSYVFEVFSENVIIFCQNIIQECGKYC